MDSGGKVTRIQKVVGEAKGFLGYCSGARGWLPNDASLGAGSLGHGGISDKRDPFRLSGGQAHLPTEMD